MQNNKYKLMKLKYLKQINKDDKQHLKRIWSNIMFSNPINQYSKKTNNKNIDMI